MTDPVLRRLEAKVDRIETALVEFIAWTAQAANSPISHDEARRLLSRLKVADGSYGTGGPK